MTGRSLLALADNLLDLVPRGLEADAQRFKCLGGDALALTDQAEQDVLGTDVVVVQHPGLFLSQDHNPPRPVGKPLEHLAAPRRTAGTGGAGGARTRPERAPAPPEASKGTDKQYAPGAAITPAGARGRPLKLAPRAPERGVRPGTAHAELHVLTGSAWPTPAIQTWRSGTGGGPSGMRGIRAAPFSTTRRVPAARFRLAWGYCTQPAHRSARCTPPASGPG